VIRTAVRGFGQTLITLGLVVMLFAAYEVWGKALEVGSEKNRLQGGLDAAWAAKKPGPAASEPVEKPVKGKGMSRLYLPRLNMDWVVVEGTDPADIRLAPGHYPASQLPGQVGNFAIAGHRMPSVWWDLDKMRDGDAMVVETKTRWIVYTVYEVHIVKPTQLSVVAQDPDRPGTAGTRKLMTLTTCNPKWDNYERLVVHGEVTREQPKSAGVPAELAGMKG
jgi:sortase A